MNTPEELEFIQSQRQERHALVEKALQVLEKPCCHVRSNSAVVLKNDCLLCLRAVLLTMVKTAMGHE